MELSLASCNGNAYCLLNKFSLLFAVGFDESFVFDISDDVTPAVSAYYTVVSVYTSISFEMFQIYLIFLYNACGGLCC
jgi:hypothetical protein